jgi:hypothetical protein
LGLVDEFEDDVGVGDEFDVGGGGDGQGDGELDTFVGGSTEDGG